MTHLLVVKKRALGDSIMGLSALQYIKSLHPDWKITYALPAWIVPFYKNVQTAADEIIAINSGFDFYSKLLEIKPDAIHELHQSGSSAKILKTYAALKQIPYTFHNHHDKGPSKVIDQGKPKAAIQRDLDGIHAFWGNNQSPSFLNFEPLIKAKKENLHKRIIIGAVATRETKMWPLENIRALVPMLQTIGYEVAIPLGPGDKKIEDALTGMPIVKIPLSELPQFFSESSLYIGNDTGIKHLAVSVGIPTLTFFGPENPSEWHPYNTNKHKYLFIENLECRTRSAHYCGLSTCDSMICLNQFKPTDVMSTIQSILTSASV